MKLKQILIAYFFTFLFSQEIHTEYYVVDGDTIDTFSYQIPENYSGYDAVPLLVTFHQWGGNENSNYSTEFDEEANQRGWLFLSPYGGSANNYNHQSMQDMVEGEILWMMENYNVDYRRIYMVGGSMGGATGAIYANNHLDPTLPMVAATASASGILDCERRFYEMDGNNSMIEWFGGTPEEVPFIYHRNSAVFFEDSTQSMHTNLQYTPLYLDFGSSEPHRYHAEDLYELLLNTNENMWIDTNPSGGHGYSVMDETHTCDWLEQFGVTQNPDFVNVNLDEPSRANWAEAIDQNNESEFIRIQVERSGDERDIFINEFTNLDSMMIYISEFIPENLHIENQTETLTLGISGLEMNHLQSIYLSNPSPFYDWVVENEIIWINFPAQSEIWVHLYYVYAIFEIENQTIELGDTSLIPVYYTMLNSELENHWGGLQLTVDYDTTITSLEAVIASEEMPESFIFSNNESIILSFSLTGETYPSGSHHMFDMEFIGEAEGTTEICFSDIIFGCPLDCWGDGFTQCGYLTVTQSCATGDGNNDAIIDILDIVLLVNQIMSGNTPTETELCHFDLNSDSTLNVLDILEIVNIIISE